MPAKPRARQYERNSIKGPGVTSGPQTLKNEIRLQINPMKKLTKTQTE